jgi:uncharacterized membrane protein YeaQ/YmgE (transglycosylase-associated protein family)
VLLTVIAVMLSGFVTGALARLAVPGPDPMPAWLTTAIGLSGSVIGGLIAVAAWGRKAATGAGLLGFVVAILLVIAYRRFYQGRPITGPEALKFPERGIGIDRFRERRSRLEHAMRQHQAQAGQEPGDELGDQLQKLADLHDAGVLTDEEFEAKRRQLVERQ